MLSVALIIFLGETGWLDDMAHCAQPPPTARAGRDEAVHGGEKRRAPRGDMRSGGPTLCDDIHGGDEQSAIATMYSMTVFYTLYFTMLAALVLWGVLYLWYSKKM